jgi:putative ABC transport system permease protein
MLMRLGVQTIFSALSQMAANKVRAALTMLGIIIGVWSITAVIAAVGALNSFVLKGFEKFGANKVQLWGEVPREMRGRMSWDSVRLTPQEAAAIRERAPSVKRLALYCNFRTSVATSLEELTGVRITAIEPEFLDINQRVLVEGRRLTETDDNDQLQVCLINQTAIDELHLNEGGLGEFISIGDRRFQIVGVLENEDRGPMFGGGEAQSEIHVPFSLAYKYLSTPWTQATIEMTSGDKSADLKEEVRFVLRHMRQLKPGDEDTFNMFIIESVVNVMRQIGNGMVMGASVLVGISLLVGGVGIMNIMLVSVSERTREIGLRKALGANPVIILLQFLLEAIILCMVGGVIGLVLGQSTVLAMNQAEFFEGAQIPVWAIILAFGFSAGVGIVFGMGPAIKAARLNPIEALRHE